MRLRQENNGYRYLVCILLTCIVGILVVFILACVCYHEYYYSDGTSMTIEKFIFFKSLHTYKKQIINTTTKNKTEKNKKTKTQCWAT